MGKRVEELAPAGRDLLERSVAWMDRYWDQERGLLWAMGDVVDPRGCEHEPYHIVRESAWYALGLLMRDREGDTGRAVQALEAILPMQFDEPGKVYHGTFYRAPEEPHPQHWQSQGQPLSSGSTTTPTGVSSSSRRFR